MSKTYKNTSEAAEEGYDISPGRAGYIMLDGEELSVKDTSGGRSFGYSYAAYLNGKEVGKTHTIWVEGTGRQKGKSVFVNRFRSDELREGVAAAKQKAAG